MYGQQFSNQGSSAAKWIFTGFFGVMLVVFLLGMNIKEATWLNSGIAKAEAERIQVETAHQQATNELQIRRETAQTEAEIRQIQREQEKLDAQHAYDLHILDQDIANRQRWADFMDHRCDISEHWRWSFDSPQYLYPGCGEVGCNGTRCSECNACYPCTADCTRNPDDPFSARAPILRAFGCTTAICGRSQPTV
jgi:hypothetical protein